MGGRSMDVVQLVPAVPDLPFEQAVLWLDRADGMPRRLEITEHSRRDADADAVEGAGQRSVPDEHLQLRGAVGRPRRGSVSAGGAPARETQQRLRRRRLAQ